MDKTVDFADVKSLSVMMTKAASVTDSPGEKSFPAMLCQLLSQIPYFRNHPEDLDVYPIPGDPRERNNVLALVRGEGSECVILTGHYDVVQTSMYGSLEPWAFDPETLSRKTLEQLGDVSGKDSPLFKLKEDLESGQFMPGRGMLDMKSGLAAGISLLARFSAPYTRKGNILFMAVADEEGSSHGMKAASRMLTPYLEERGLKAAAVFNLDSSVDQENGELGRAVFTGSVGKTLPFVFFIGKCTHAGAPFDGVSPVLPAAEFAREMECNPDALGERQTVPGEEPPPPTILYMREGRMNYDVTTPQSVFCAVNVLSHTRSPREVLDTIGRIASQAMDKAVSTLRERVSTLSRRVSGHMALPAIAPAILGFDEFSARAERTSPGIVQKVRVHARMQTPDDPVRQTMEIMLELAPFANIEGPAAVIGFAPPYYARAELDTERHARFTAMLRTEVSKFSTETGVSVRLRPYFQGISDMSFLEPSDGAEQRSFVETMSPASQGESGNDFTGLGCPVVNAGPWGRDYHQAGERVNIEYAFTRLPELLWRLVSKTFGLSGETLEQ